MDAPSPSNERADPTRDVFESAAGIDVASNIADDVADISPKNRSLHPPFGPSSPSTTVASADGDISSPSSAWKSTLPETPRWRFVSRAKKTKGYSSSAAGTFVIGKSGEELAGKFIAPVWNASRGKNQEGMIVGSDSSDGVEEVRGGKEGNAGKVKKPSLIVDDATETFEYAGKVFEENLCVNNHNDDERSMVDLEEAPNLKEMTTFENEVLAESMLQTPILVPSTVLLISQDPEGEEPVLTRTLTTAKDEQWDWLEEQMSENDPTLSAPATLLPSPQSLRESPMVAPAEDVQQRPTTKRRAFACISLLLLLAIAVILGIILGGNESENVNADNIAAGANDASGGKAQNVPSQYPTAYCPVNTKLFSIQHKTLGEGNTSMNLYPKTWVLKESCSDTKIAKCLPCVDSGDTSLVPSSSLSSLFNNSAPNATTTPPNSSTYSSTMSSYVQPFVGVEKYAASSDGVSGCIPDGYEYVFEVKPSDKPEECCGFLPYSFVMSYYNVEVINDDSIFYDSEGNRQSGGKVSFPENAEPCPTSEPSSIPSATPSGASSEAPSATPSQVPSLYPTTQPTRYPTASPMMSSSSSPTPSPSISPTSRPSSAQLTTLRPTEKPVCDATYEDFNLCLAIDMSGSVCNKGTGFECVACDPELICYDSDVDKGTCCNNFLDLIEFAKSIIGAFGTVAAQRSFSTVAFATDAELVSELATASEAMDTLDALTFTGGRTNHAAAINTCRTSLETSTLSDRKNFLLLITDGNPSEPVSVPEAEAEAAAEVAKSGGVIIVPVMIKQAVSSYLQGISSDGTVLDASDFDAMISLQTTLMAQVECQ